MSTLINGTELREISLGRYVQGKTTNITTGGAATFQVFNITGGEVLITGFWGKVTTAVTVANTVAAQANPTTGDTQVIVTATDLGTTDTAAGSVVGLTRGTTAASSFLRGGSAVLNAVVTTGAIEVVTTGTNPDGVIEWYCTYVPLTPGAAVASA